MCELVCARVSPPYSQRRLQILASHVEIRDHMPILVVSDVTMSSTFERYKTRCPSLAHRRSESAMLRRLRLLLQLRRGSRRILLRDYTKRGKTLLSLSSNPFCDRCSVALPTKRPISAAFFRRVQFIRRMGQRFLSERYH